MGAAGDGIGGQRSETVGTAPRFPKGPVPIR
jgi:hypothetical protein